MRLIHLLPQAVLKHNAESPFELRIPEFTVNPGELVAVVGRVGAGKSSLLQALMGNMKTVSSGGSGGRVCREVGQVVGACLPSLRMPCEAACSRPACTAAENMCAG